MKFIKPMLLLLGITLTLSACGDDTHQNGDTPQIKQKTDNNNNSNNNNNTTNTDTIIDNNSNNTDIDTNTDTNNNNNNNNTDADTVTDTDNNNDNSDNYSITQVKNGLTVGDTIQLQVYKNGSAFDGASWSSDNEIFATVDESGLVTALFPGEVNIIATIDEKTTVSSNITVNARNSTMYKFAMEKGTPAVDKDTGHVVVAFVSVKIDNYGQTRELSFTYDVATEKCLIKSVLHGNATDGTPFVLAGYNDFIWGDYKNGSFYGGYSHNNPNNELGYDYAIISFDNKEITFYNHSEIYLPTTYTYYTEHSDWEAQDVETIVEPIWVRVQECPLYAKDMFEKFKYNLTLF